ncbi:hypothetical protein KSS87_001130 [Heliosperma pusillum]|nr:hypothetical protein KSS87_001130 [Heliosperma pusillum]
MGMRPVWFLSTNPKESQIAASTDYVQHPVHRGQSVLGIGCMEIDPSSRHKKKVGGVFAEKDGSLFLGVAGRALLISFKKAEELQILLNLTVFVHGTGIYD